MRNALCAALVERAADPRFVFLTGDLGFMALEPLRDKMGKRFVNAGVAEQNMVGVAAGLATQGFSPWVYSIAPFMYARPYEFIRNDICLHDAAVKLIGNGGGYGYGVMGQTHHALEDYGILLALKNMSAFIPAFAEDVHAIIGKLMEYQHPAYLRLGRDEKPQGLSLPPYATWRKLLTGSGPTMVVVGPLAGGLLDKLSALEEKIRPELWVVTELPVSKGNLPGEFLQGLKKSGHLFVVEEHVEQGGAGQMLALALLETGQAPAKMTLHCARGYVSGYYGSQEYHRRESGLDAASVIKVLRGQ